MPLSLRNLDKYQYVHYSGRVDIKESVIAFSALAQETRLRVFRLLVEHGQEGAPAGVLREALDIPHNTLSFHLAHMSHAKLVFSRRNGRSIIYRANFEFFTNLIRFMVEDCCSAEIASIRKGKKKGRSIIKLRHCCEPTEKEKAL